MEVLPPGKIFGMNVTEPCVTPPTSPTVSLEQPKTCEKFYWQWFLKYIVNTIDIFNFINSKFTAKCIAERHRYVGSIVSASEKICVGTCAAALWSWPITGNRTMRSHTECISATNDDSITGFVFFYFCFFISVFVFRCSENRKFMFVLCFRKSSYRITKIKRNQINIQSDLFTQLYYHIIHNIPNLLYFFL